MPIMFLRCPQIVFAMALASSSGGCDKRSAPEAKPDPVTTPVSAKTEPSKTNAAPPQAGGVVAVLQAVKAGDLAAFKGAMSKRILASNDNKHWERNLKEAQEKFAKRYGDYRGEDFEFTFKGDAEQGMLTVLHPPSEPIELHVVREGDDWKLDSH